MGCKMVTQLPIAVNIPQLHLNIQNLWSKRFKHVLLRGLDRDYTSLNIPMYATHRDYT